MKGRAKGVFCVIFGLFVLLIAMGSKSQDEKFYEEAKTTTGTVKLVSKETRTVKRRRSSGGYRTRRVTEYNAKISYDVEKNGEIVNQVTLFEDVSSKLKEGDTVTVYYTNEKARIKSQVQSKASNTMLVLFAIVAIAVGVIGYCNSKPEGEYDELSGEDNIYRNDDYY